MDEPKKGREIDGSTAVKSSRCDKPCSLHLKLGSPREDGDDEEEEGEAAELPSGVAVESTVSVYRCVSPTEICFQTKQTNPNHFC
ncbi:hypothetical protein F2P81_004356 [Scophthalmus maximus]|uniref:Uncharacterized protein n=1 Tax=Scophthalmus maximus TaxID=52904 RepID=A0A6A4TDS9_SCOMX|nr:hypothetical protein F2P81_004356 [Scophthalmus maximus]